MLRRTIIPARNNYIPALDYDIPTPKFQIYYLVRYIFFDLLLIMWYTFTINRKEYSMQTVVTSKGQVVIPSIIRRKLGVKEGTYLQVDVDEQTKKIILTPITREYVQSLRGKYKGKGLMKALMAEKLREKEF
jgi:AbrB family looped-hinge helix DNA binding protein